MWQINRICTLSLSGTYTVESEWPGYEIPAFVANSICNEEIQSRPISSILLINFFF